MHLIKRLYLSAFGTIDSVVDRLQNHDALVRASLGELDDKLKEARTSFAVLTRTLNKTEEDIRSAGAEQKLWQQRAKEKAGANQREAALECVRRAQRAERSTQQLEGQRNSSANSRRRLEQTIAEMENMQKTLTLKHRELRVREQCQGLSQFSPFTSVKEAEAMLSRWEDTLGGESTQMQVDSFESEFEVAEQRAALEEELDRLLTEA